MAEDQVRAYIFAGGNNERWEADYPKEMAEVDGIPVLYRTFIQCRERNLNPVVVSHKPEITGDARFTYTKFITNQFPTLVHACREVDWGEKCLFLLGDVYYTDKAWMIIQSQPSFFFGNEVELFAVKFTSMQHTKMLIAMNDAIKNWEENNGRGKLWETYRAYNGWLLNQKQIGDNLCLIEDETTDFDTVEKYEEFLYENTD